MDSQAACLITTDLFLYHATQELSNSPDSSSEQQESLPVLCHYPSCILQSVSHVIIQYGNSLFYSNCNPHVITWSGIPVVLPKVKPLYVPHVSTSCGHDLPPLSLSDLCAMMLLILHSVLFLDLHPVLLPSLYPPCCYPICALCFYPICNSHVCTPLLSQSAPPCYHLICHPLVDTHSLHLLASDTHSLWSIW